MKFDLYTQTGEKKGQIEASDAIFAVEPNKQLVQRALVRQNANGRQSGAHTKTRGEVAGSTKKIYRQKGTGGARHGSRYANLFRGGGVVFGPKNERNYTKRMPRKQRRLAIFSALSERAKNKSIIALESYKVDKPKTKDAVRLIGKLPVTKNVLFIEADKNFGLEKSVSNIPNAKIISVNFLNVADILKYQTIVFLQDALKKSEELYLSTKA